MPANKNSPCADVPGKSFKPAPMFTKEVLTMTGKGRGKVRGQAQETVDWGSNLQKRAELGTASFLENRAMAPR